MAREHSFGITLSNNVTADVGLQHLLASEPAWFVPDSKSRRAILDALGLEKRFSRAFDLVWVKGRKRDAAEASMTVSPENIVLIELKTTVSVSPKTPAASSLAPPITNFNSLRNRATPSVSVSSASTPKRSLTPSSLTATSKTPSR